MKLIKGENLTQAQVSQVKAAFIHRWTTENLSRAKRLLNQYGFSYPAIEPVTDEQWIEEHSFWFKNNGSLADKPRYAKPVYMADDSYYSRDGRK